MSSRNRFYVSPHDDGWCVKRAKGERASSVHDTKEEAVEAGRTLAQNNEPSSLYIQRKDGTMEEERTYGGTDPASSEG